MPAPLREGDVAVINRTIPCTMRRRGYALSLAWLLAACSGIAYAAVLPENRSDILYHHYEGGGVKVNGPALLVRKDVADKVSLSASYYVDNVTSASPDVVSTASPYTEKRTEYAGGIDYLYKNTLVGFTYTTSEEPDYLADTFDFRFSQEMFGGMTTVNMGYSVGKDFVLNSRNSAFTEPLNRYQYQLGLTQVLTRSIVLNVDYELIDDDGYTASPYRAARVGGAPRAEIYPGTRTGRALAMRLKKAWRYETNQWLAAVSGGYRFYWDTWNINAHTLELGYHQYFGPRWLMDWTYRYYSQNQASFYSDNFATPKNFMARDKELSTFNSHTVGVQASYVLGKFNTAGGGQIKNSINIAYNLIMFDYDNYTVGAGELYSFNADVLRLYWSIWY